MSDDKTQHLIQLLKDDNQKELDAIYKQKWKNDIDFKTIYDAIFNLENPSIHKIIGDMYRYGFYVEQDNETAFHYYQSSVDQGNKNAQYGLGNMYYYGRHVEQDYETAFHYFQLSADQGNHRAQNNLKNLIRKWDNVDEYIAKLINENNNLKKDISNLEIENTELRYTPGNIGYQEAEKHWNEML